jgi:hypothetical protein
MRFGSPLPAACRAGISRAVAYLPLQIPGGCPSLPVENLGVHIIHKRLGVGLPVDVKLLDGLNSNPERYLSPDNGGRVLVQVRDFHPSRLIEKEKEWITAFTLAFVIGRDPVMNDRLGKEAHNR